MKRTKTNVYNYYLNRATITHHSTAEDSSIPVPNTSANSHTITRGLDKVVDIIMDTMEEDKVANRHTLRILNKEVDVRLPIIRVSYFSLL